MRLRPDFVVRHTLQFPSTFVLHVLQFGSTRFGRLIPLRLPHAHVPTYRYRSYVLDFTTPLAVWLIFPFTMPRFTRTLIRCGLRCYLHLTVPSVPTHLVTVGLRIPASAVRRLPALPLPHTYVAAPRLSAFLRYHRLHTHRTFTPRYARHTAYATPPRTHVYLPFRGSALRLRRLPHYGCVYRFATHYTRITHTRNTRLAMIYLRFIVWFRYGRYTRSRLRLPFTRLLISRTCRFCTLSAISRCRYVRFD